MLKSLYAAFGERVTGVGSDPGTLYTASVETIDNDVIMQEIGILTDAEPSPKTRLAEMVGDAALPTIEPFGSGPRLGPTPRPRPRPGTRLTETVETTDEDSSTYLDLLR